jgi:hypothetical protein
VGETVATTEPERELVRRALPFFIPVAALAFLVGSIVADAGAGWSAAFGIVLVAANLVASGLSIAWAARISPVMLFAVGLGGFVVRMGIFLAILLALNSFRWFSAGAFISAFVPGTLALLVYEMRFIASPKVQSDLWYFREQGS